MLVPSLEPLLYAERTIVDEHCSGPAAAAGMLAKFPDIFVLDRGGDHAIAPRRLRTIRAAMAWASSGVGHGASQGYFVTAMAHLLWHPPYPANAANTRLVLGVFAGESGSSFRRARCID